METPIYTCNGNSIELQEILEGMRHKLIVRYANEPYRVFCENGSVVHIEPQFQTVDYIPGTKPGEGVIDGICQLVDEFYSNNNPNQIKLERKVKMELS